MLGPVWIECAITFFPKASFHKSFLCVFVAADGTKLGVRTNFMKIAANIPKGHVGNWTGKGYMECTLTNDNGNYAMIDLPNASNLGTRTAVVGSETLLHYRPSFQPATQCILRKIK